MRFVFGVATIILMTPASFAQEIIISAANLAPLADRADEPTPGKWWLHDDLLLSGKVTDAKAKPGEWQVIPVERFIPKKVPTIIYDPKVKGWHRIYVRLLHDPLEPNGKVFARLTREPFPEYLVTNE